MKVFTTAVLLVALLVLIVMPARILAGSNEVPSSCNGHCQPDCANPDISCITVCRVGSVCADGYIRKHQGGPCILKSECPELAGRR